MSLFDPTAPHAVLGSQQTSRVAAAEVLPRTGTIRRAILVQLLACGTRWGATDAELCQQLGISGDTERPRRVELVEGGWVTDSGRRRQTTSGHDAIVWVPTDAALEAASREEHR